MIDRVCNSSVELLKVMDGAPLAAGSLQKDHVLALAWKGLVLRLTKHSETEIKKKPTKNHIHVVRSGIKCKANLYFDILVLNPWGCMPNLGWFPWRDI